MWSVPVECLIEVAFKHSFGAFPWVQITLIFRDSSTFVSEISQRLFRDVQRFSEIFRDFSDMFRDVSEIVQRFFRDFSDIVQRIFSDFLDTSIDCLKRFRDCSENYQRLFRDVSDIFQIFSETEIAITEQICNFSVGGLWTSLKHL